MTLKQRLQDDLTSAMRNRDEMRKRTLRMALTEIKLKEVEVGEELSDGDIAAILQKEMNQRLDTLAQLDQVDRPELVAAERAALDILEEYLPKQLDRDEIAERARQVIAELNVEGLGAMGQVMRTLMSELKGQADGKLVNQVVRELLTN
jgi:uncharacterized protein YqeY